MNTSADMARWHADVQARKLALEAGGLLCDRCGSHVDGISRYPEGWLCDSCVAVMDRPEDDEDYAYDEARWGR